MSRIQTRDRRLRRRVPEWLGLLLFTLAGAALASVVVTAWDASAGDGDRTTESVPRTLSWEGRLELDGQPVSSAVPLRFSLIDGGGAVLWTEEHSTSTSLGAVPVNAGRYSVALGTLTPLPDVIADGEPLFLRVAVGDGSGGWTTLLGDTPVDASPWAQWSTRATELLVGASLSIDDDRGASTLAGLMTDGQNGDPVLARFGSLTIDAGQNLGHGNLVAGATKVAGNSTSQVYLDGTGAAAIEFHDSNPRLSFVYGPTGTSGTNVPWSDALVVESDNQVGFRRNGAQAPLHLGGITDSDGASASSGSAGTLVVTDALSVTSLRADGAPPMVLQQFGASDFAPTSLPGYGFSSVGTPAATRACWIQDFAATASNVTVSEGVSAYVLAGSSDVDSVVVINHRTVGTSQQAGVFCLSDYLVDDQR